MKKLVSLLLVLVMTLGCAALAEEASAALSLSILDENGAALVGAEVTVVNAEHEVVETYISAEDVHVLENLAHGTYTVKATDPQDGYTAAESVYLDADLSLELVIRKLQAGKKAVVGSVTRLSGSFFTEMWGNNTSDIDVRALLHGQSTVAWTMERQYGIDETVVADVKATTEKGNKTYTFTLNDNLAYNDGTKITAADYVFSVLLQSADETMDIGAKALLYSQLVGHTAYHTGESEVFEGVRLIDEDTFALTIDGDYLPYFYELMFVNVIPYPISVIAPGCEVKDDGKGAYIEGEFTSELLAKTILDPETGYLSHPSVSSGPYMLLSYDEETGTAQFAVNPYYPGNYQGVKPVIELLELRELKYAQALDQLASGEIDIINKATSGEFIDTGLERFGAGEFNAANYMRTGYGFLAYACEESATASVKVRQAMAHCFDGQKMIQDYLKSYGMEVYSYYGLGQWMAQEYAMSMQDQVTVYPVDTAAAVSLLEEDGWTLNAAGGEFAAGTDAVRYKLDEQGELIPLEIRFAKLKDNEAAQWVLDNFAPVLTEIGFSFQTTEVTFDELLLHYYRQTERTYNLMYLATNFAMVFDPYYTFHTDDAYQGALNTSGIADEELMELALNLRRTPSGDEETYIERWVELMKHFSDILPTLPIYSNVYYDFFANDLMQYEPNAHWGWASAILYSYFAE